MADAVADPYGLVGRKLDGRYNVEAVVAEGGFGVVYRGRHPTLDRTVAIKVARESGRDESARRLFAESFLREARTIAALEHPAVVRVLDHGVTPVGRGAATPWMVLEWVEGRTLAEDLDARRGRGGRTPDECMALLRSVIEALASAHEAGVAHRDVKPSNVMLPARVASGAPRAKVLDFGVVKRMERDESVGSGHTGTRADFVAVSLPYASPEQVSATRTGPWTDVHALGLVLTEVLVDDAPYRSADTVALTAEVMSSERPTPARFGVDVGAWEAVLARAVAVQPSERYANAGELLRALDEALPRARHTSLAASGRKAASTLRGRVRPVADERPSSRSFAAWTALFFTLASVPSIALLVVVPLRAKREASARTAPIHQPATPAPVVAAAVVSEVRDASVITPDAGAALADAPSPIAPDSGPRRRVAPARPSTFHGLPANQI